jgi:hypothetical protein
LQSLSARTGNKRGASDDQSDHQDGDGDESPLESANLPYGLKESPDKPVEPVNDSPEESFADAAVILALPEDGGDDRPYGIARDLTRLYCEGSQDAGATAGAGSASSCSDIN